MKILIIQTAFIGDVVLATALIEKLKESMPDSSVDFLLRKGNEGLLKDHPKLNKVLVFDKKNGKYRNLFKLVRTIRSESYDYVINVQRFFTTGLISALSGGKTIVGFDKNPLSLFFDKQIPHEISEHGIIHEVDRNLKLLEGIADAKRINPKLYPSESDMRVIPEGIEYLCIAPASVWFTKQFPAEKWIELIQQLPEKFKIYLIGAKSDLPLCEHILTESKSENVEILAGKLSFLESAALISKAKMTFANDSAPVHFASSMNAPVAEVYCSTIPEFGFGPLSDESYVLQVHEELECRPCGLHGLKACPKGHFKCADIEIKSILNTTGLN